MYDCTDRQVHGYTLGLLASVQPKRICRSQPARFETGAEWTRWTRRDHRRPPELLDLVAERDTLVVIHIDRLSQGLTYGLQVIEGLHETRAEQQSKGVSQARFWRLSGRAGDLANITPAGAVSQPGDVNCDRTTTHASAVGLVNLMTTNTQADL